MASDMIVILNFCVSRIFVSTWNVGGKSPPKNLNLEEWLHASPPADIYVLGLVSSLSYGFYDFWGTCIWTHGLALQTWWAISFCICRFQEIVPLNAGNVLGAEDNGPAKKWLTLIRRTLNTLPGTHGCGSYSTPSPVPDPLVELDADFEGSSVRQHNSSYFHRHSFHSMSRSLRINGDIMELHPRLDRRFSVCDRVSTGSRPSDFDSNFRCGDSSDDEKVAEQSPSAGIFSPSSYAYGAPQYMGERNRSSSHTRYSFPKIYFINSIWFCLIGISLKYFRNSEL